MTLRILRSQARQAAFSLVELVVVLGIVALLLALSAPQVAGVLNAARLRTAADSVQSRLLEARSLPMLFNTDTELRFYEVPDLVDPASRPTVRKLRILILQQPGPRAAAVQSDVFEPAESG